MALYKITWKKSAAKELKKIDRQFIPDILAAVESLAIDPLPTGHKKLKGTDHTFRIRINDYRVVYLKEDEWLLIEVVRVGHRQSIYKK